VIDLKIKTYPNSPHASWPRNADIDMVVIHTAETPDMGDFLGALNRVFQSPTHGGSTHFGVDTDGRIGRFAEDSLACWSCGHSGYNHRSLSIEHEGYAKDKNWNDAMLEASAKLVAFLCEAYDIPVDRDHIIGHNEVPYPNTHTDPGPHWPWEKYMAMIRKHYSGEGPSDLPVPAIEVIELRQAVMDTLKDIEVDRRPSRRTVLASLEQAEDTLKWVCDTLTNWTSRVA
jgi:N-acetyl-anhydromuramyl-L-alanine amidase AmpD